ncbi:MAG TPA: hypothetical protein VJT70_01210 [Sphingomicrobium sp.]|nr:hypothetical protein [Sphingomicrobium sp.]
MTFGFTPAVGQNLTAEAGAFRGHIVGTTGSVVRIPTSPTAETITIGSHRASINWVPSDQRIGGGAIDFLPNGNTATFTSAEGITDYTVLNRIVPIDVTRPISLNGSVISTLQGTHAVGGKVWFYSPGGIVIGASAVFDVGGLLLTTDHIADFSADADGFSVLFSGGAPPSLSASGIKILPGAQINALQRGSYVALIAPRIEQGGKVRVDGSVAYAAGEQLTMTMSHGLFDIQIDVGTSDPNGIVHTGETTGRGNAGPDGHHTIYMAAVPKNQALTMLLGGIIGFDVAHADIQNGQIILKSGDAINFTGGKFTSSLMASAAGSVLIDGKVDFETAMPGNTVTIDAGRNIELDTDTGSLQMRNPANQLAGALILNAANVWMANRATLTQLETNANYAGRDAALAINSGTSNLDGFLGADSVTIRVSSSLFGQNSGTSVDLAGITVGTGGFSIVNTGGTPAAVNVYGRQVLAGSAVTGIAFATAANVSGPFVSGSKINGCEIGTNCQAPPAPSAPPAAPALPRFDFFAAPERAAQVSQVFDFSQLNAGDGDVQIDSGVTSGADSTSWDEISVDRDGPADTCPDAASTKAGDKGAPAVCKGAGAATKP